MNKKKLDGVIFVDFDDVLMDTVSFKKDYFKIFSEFGVPLAKVYNAYLRMRKAIGRDEPRCHIKILRKKYPTLAAKRLEKKLYKFRGRSKKYVFRDAKSFLKNLKKAGYHLILFTSGNPEAQHKKIKASGLSRFFEAIYFAKNDFKSRIIKKFFLPKSSRFIFIDDKKKVVEDVKKNFPGAIVIQLARRHDSQKSRRVDVVSPNLKIAERLIRNAKIKK